MGHQIEQIKLDPERRRHFVRNVLTDLRALDVMIREQMFEREVRRIGAEQEVVLVDEHWRPALVALEVLEGLPPEHFTTELALFNVEYNSPPLEFGGDCLSRLHGLLAGAMAQIRTAAEAYGARPILTGILPTLRKSDLEMESVTPKPRYYSLVERLRDLRGEAYEFRFTGVDELIMRHESAMMEACNTSSQFHFQVSPEEFPRLYNIAQAVAGPTLAAAVNSPMLFGHRLWRETRISLFQQALDTRRPVHALEERSARVRFGESWVRESVLELYREDVARFRAILAENIAEDPFTVLEAGGVPKLKALQLHNGTIYRWNRACYGITKGRPHLRIENRLLPSGPTIIDEVANAAFWFGLISGVAWHYEDVTRHIPFDSAKGNFLLAARLGLATQFRWLDGRTAPAPELIREELLPLARDGLTRSGVDAGDIDRFLGVVDERVRVRRTGAQWLLDSFEALDGQRSRRQRLDALTAVLWNRQQEDTPVHEWEIASREEAEDWVNSFARVDQIMTTDVFTVHEDDVIDLAASLMDWKHIRHVPVENSDHCLIGLITYRQLLRFLANDLPHGRSHPVPVRDVMQHDPVTITPGTSTLDAIRIMRSKNVPCLPVVQSGRLVGIITERDFVTIATQLLEERLESVLQRPPSPAAPREG